VALLAARALEVGNHEAANLGLSLCLPLTVMQIPHIELQDATGDKPGIVIVEVRPNRSGVRLAIRFSLDADAIAFSH
jgi:hypothetical protein